jgi:hypothetical protein
MIVVARLSMMGMQRGRGTPNQNSARDQRLQTRSLLQNILKRRLHTHMLSDQITNCLYSDPLSNTAIRWDTKAKHTGPATEDVRGLP